MEEQPPGKLADFCRTIGTEQTASLVVPCIKELSADASQHVRSALAGVDM